MTPYKQLYRHRPDEGSVGDCFRTAIACLLDIEPELVPHVMEDAFNEPESAETAHVRMNSYLIEHHGLYHMEFPLRVVQDGPPTDVMQHVKRYNGNVHYLLTGLSANEVAHTVVCTGDRIVHDPSIDCSGIIGPLDNDGEWFYWLGFLLPSRMVML